MTLLELQRRMSEDVRRPLTDDFGMQSTTEEGRPLEAIASTYIAPNARLSSFERLEIYNRQYWFRLSSALTEDYPALRAVVGPKRFEVLTSAYLREYPSTSWTLRDLGSKLPAFLRTHLELCGHRHRLATDVADLEWAYVEAFDGKQLDPIAPEAAQAIGPHSRIALQPHLQLLELHYPVDELVLAVKRAVPEADIVSAAAHQSTGTAKFKLPSIKTERLFLAVHRHENMVYYRRMEREGFRLLRALSEGKTVTEAIQEAYATSRIAHEAKPAQLQNIFSLAAQLGWFCSHS